LTASELAFLALGLGLGIPAGAALLDILKSRPPAPRFVQVTIAPSAIPRRAATLSTMLIPAPNAPAPMGPADRRHYDRVDEDEPPLLAVGPRTAGQEWAADGTVVQNGSRPDAAALVLPARYGSIPRLTTVDLPLASSDREMVAFAIDAGSDSTLAALGANGAAMVATTAVAVLEPDAPSRAVGSAADEAGAGSPPDRIDDGPCSEPRRLADERCAVADRASAEAGRAADELHAARRAYDQHLTRAETAAADADPRAVRAAKDAAQHAYRVARSGASTPEEQEQAAATWLAEINRINAATKEADATVAREREAASALVLAIERLTVHADAARISAESAQEICVQARETLAECEERAAAPGAGGVPVGPPWPEPEQPRDDELGLPDEASTLTAATGAGPAPRIMRLLRGERAALVAIVDAMAGHDPGQRRHWQLLVTDLADAIIARAIEESILDFPDEHPFWGSFTRPQSRDIAAALASLGYRSDAHPRLADRGGGGPALRRGPGGRRRVPGRGGGGRSHPGRDDRPPRSPRRRPGRLVE